MIGDGSELVEALMRFRPDGLTANAWAIKAGVSRTIWADLKRHGNPSRKTLEKLLEAAGSSLAEFEALRIGPSAVTAEGEIGRLGERRGSFGSAKLGPLPLIASYPSTDPVYGWQAMRIVPAEVADRLLRPASLASDRDAFAVRMVGEAMWPRFRAGRPIAVSPSATVHDGDDVSVVLRRAGSRAGQTVLVAELAKRTGGALHLRRFMPDRSVAVAIADIAAVHKVLGEMI